MWSPSLRGSKRIFMFGCASPSFSGIDCSFVWTLKRIPRALFSASSYSCARAPANSDRTDRRTREPLRMTFSGGTTGREDTGRIRGLPPASGATTATWPNCSLRRRDGARRSAGVRGCGCAPLRRSSAVLLSRALAAVRLSRARAAVLLHPAAARRLIGTARRGAAALRGVVAALSRALVVGLVEARALEDHACAGADQALQLVLAALRALPQR